MRFIIPMAVLASLAFAVPASTGGHQSPLVIPAAAFQEVGAEPDVFYFHNNGYLEGEGETIAMTAAAYLPGGATVRRLTLYGYDNTDSCDSPNAPTVYVWLMRRNIYTGDVEHMASAWTTGASSFPQHHDDTSIVEAWIDNLNYIYYVRLQICSYSHRLYSVAIDYTE